MPKSTLRIAALSMLTLLLLSSAPVNLQRFLISLNDINHMSEWRASAAFSTGATREYLVVWEQYADDSYTASSIFGQFVYPDGRLHGSRFEISPSQQSKPGLDEQAHAAYNPDLDQFLVVYGRSQAGIYARTVDHAHVLGTEVTIKSAGTSENVFTPVVGYSPTSHKYIVVWAHRYSDNTQAIEAWALTSAGVKSGALIQFTLPINPFPSDPAIAWSAHLNEFLVVWQRPVGAQDCDIFGRRYIWSVPVPLSTDEFTILSGPRSERDPAVGSVTKPNGTGQFLVVSESYDDGTGDIHVTGQRVTETGTLDGSRLADISGPQGASPSVAGTSGADQQFMVGWILDYNDVALRPVSNSGGLGTQYSYASHGIYNLEVTPGPTGDFLVTVDDWWNTSTSDVVGYLWGNRAFLPLITR